MIEIQTHSATETIRIGVIVAGFLRPGDVIAFTGDLAAGKTTMIKGICAGLNVSQNVDSPTFTLVNEYSGRFPVYHIDCYREHRTEEWLELGIQEYLFDDGVSLVEWAEEIASLLPTSAVHIVIEQNISDESFRRIKLTADPNMEADLLHLISLNEDCKC
ncbi:MAG: tRNA (adenosine(37)-N6)-threonylcarbamoyltransferase complex ATPase subunit type 1 TsaE [Candidatus Marinimicrobia bacterium CG08_land_8_20_14_0_20_45_22]|nr:MAG: tRNA (adenosine(37)-N6)-threonylcarbamoyltransferase complex ATPase subunit type 1 TsaE [Candidatus Marinimicrobia bacterium CG08_land_8_20_14_0_20_45_22]